MKLAIVGLSSFGYLERLCQRIAARGTVCEFFDERPANDVMTKLALRFAPAAFKRLLSRRHLRAMCDRIVEGGFTHVLIMFAEVIDAPELERLRSHGIRLSRFTWDSLANRPQVKRLDYLMDAIASFDPKDCADQGYIYIPLYCEHVPTDLDLYERDRKWDFYFCGTMHSIRPRIIAKVVKASETRGWASQLKLFYHSSALYIIRNIFDPVALRLRDRISDVGFPHSEILRDCAHSKVVIDIHHPMQEGLTMRTFESLAQGCILLTTNTRAQSILGHMFASRVFLLEEGDIERAMERAVSAKPSPLSAASLYWLSVERFIDEILQMATLQTSRGDVVEARK